MCGHIDKGKDIAHTKGTNNIRGITVYGIPIGTTAFPSGYLEKEVKRIKDKIVTTGK